jgi:hypothetical protein
MIASPTNVPLEFVIPVEERRVKRDYGIAAGFR